RLHAVLQREDNGVRADERFQQPGRALDVVELHREDDDVDGADRRGVVGGLDRRNMDVALRTPDVEAARLHGRQVRAAGDERDVLACRRQASSEVPTDTARAENRNGHDSSLIASRLTTGSSPSTVALWTAPRGTSTQSPVPSTARCPPMTSRKRPDTTASILLTPCA